MLLYDYFKAFRTFGFYGHLYSSIYHGVEQAADIINMDTIEMPAYQN